MDELTLDRIAEGIARREYSLLLGAGVSMGSLGGNGVPLPSGPGLRDRLVQEFSIPVENQIISLSRAYAAAKRDDADGLATFMRSWFTGCQPDWQGILADFEWQRIWTLNVDDIVETVCQTGGVQYDRFDWTSNFRDTANSDRQIIHLHGYVDEPTEGHQQISELVFSISEYAATLKDTKAWHTVFTDEFADRPFIVLGASLIDEYDLQRALTNSGALTARGFPSVIVLKSVSVLERAELSALGLLVIESDAQSFLVDIGNRIHKYVKTIDQLYDRSTSQLIPTFLQQFDDLRRYDPQHGAHNRHFYSGYEPHWRNILDEDDALLERTEQSFSAILATSNSVEPSQGVHILIGTSGTGKSTGLLRIARQFIAEGLPTFRFRAEEDLDVHAAVEWLQHMPNTVLIFNDCADFADSIGELAEQCAASDTDLLVIGAERSTRRTFLENKISPRFLHLEQIYEYRTLSNRDIDSLIDKLASRTRLGKITRWRRADQRQYFRRTASRRLFEGMADLEGGPGFRARIKNNFRLIDDDHIKNLYAASSIAYEFGYPLPLAIASRVASLKATDIASNLVDDAQEMMVLGSHGVHPPHRMTARMVVESALSTEEKFCAVKSLATALAPHIDIRAIRKLTLQYRLIRRLMDQETVIRLVGPQFGRQIYEHMEGLYDWNGRYWEQRALFESGLGNHHQARSYAEHSLQIHWHPFALNTLGTVLARIAVDHGDADALREAIKHLDQARYQRRWDESEHPYVTFFSMMVRFGETWGLSAIPAPLRAAFTEWHRSAQRSPAFAHANTSSQLQQFQVDWLNLAVVTRQA